MGSSDALRLASVANKLSIWDYDGAALDSVHEYLPIKGGDVLTASWSFDGSSVACAIKDNPKIVMTYSVRKTFTSAEIRTVENPLDVLMMKKKSPKIAIGTPNSVSIYDINNDKTFKSFQLKDSFSCFASNFNDSYIAVGCRNGSIYLINNVTNTVSDSLKKDAKNTQKVSCLSYSKRAILASASHEGAVYLWDCNTNTSIKSFKDHLAPATKVKFSPLNENLLLSTGLDKRCIFYDSKSRKSINTFKTDYPLTALDVFPNGQQIILGSSKGKILIYDLRSFVRPLVVQSAHSTSINNITCQPQAKGAFKALPRSNVVKSTVNLRNNTKVVNKENLPNSNNPNAIKNKDLKEISFATSSKSNLLPGDNVTKNDPKISLSPIVSPSKTPPSRKRESIGSQIFSPVGDLTMPGTSRSPSLSINSTVNMSQDGVLSPIRHESSILNASGSFLNKTTPIEKFNQSITTPLISPLTMITEEDINGEEEEKESEEKKDLNYEIKKTIPSISLSEATTTVASQSVINDRNFLEPKSLNQETIPSSSKINQDVVASTPYTKPTILSDSIDCGRKNEDDVGDLNAIFTAFPGPSIEDRAKNFIDPNVLNNESKLSSNKLTDFQQEYITNCVKDAMNDYMLDMQELLWHMQYDSIRLFQTQKEEIRDMFQMYAINENLVQEVQRLTKENEELKKFY